METKSPEFVWTDLDEKCNAIHVASPEELQQLLADGADPNLRNVDGVSVLVEACADDLWRYDMLVAAGARLQEADLPLALHYACRAGKRTMVERLLPDAITLGIDVWGPAAIHGAAASHDSLMLDWVLRLGAPVNGRDERGQTPLHIAVGIYRNLNMLVSLVHAGADVEAETDAGETALDYVERRAGIGCPDEYPRGPDELAAAEWLRALMQASQTRTGALAYPHGKVSGRVDATRDFGPYVLHAKVISDPVSTFFVAHRRAVDGERLLIRILHDHLADDPRHVEAFLAEGRAGIAVGPDANVPVLDVGRLEGRVFWVLEFERGVARACRAQPPLEWRPIPRWLP